MIEHGKRWFGRFDTGFLVVAAICLIAVWPFLARPGLPQGTDAELHVYRLAELSGLVRGGELYPRWAPNFYFGYGYPIFNYYAPLSYYLGLLIELWPPFDAVLAVKTLFVAGLLASGLGMYGFMRDEWGRPAGYVAAAVYVYAPYVQYVDPHARGDLAESLSFALFALALWALNRLRRSGGAGAWLGATVGVAAVILVHNLMALVFFGLLFAWVLWHWRTLPRARVGRLLLALLLGVGLSAFFWLPVGLERNAVNLSSLVGDGGHFDFRNHFVSLQQLFGPSRRLDWGASEPAFALNVGVAQWLLAALGVATLASGRARKRRHALFFVLAGAVLLFLMTPAAQAVWEVVPLLPFLQFPWRLLGATVAMLAVLAGVGSDALVRAPIPLRHWVPAMLVGLVFLPALPLSQVPPWSPEPWDTSALAVMLIERKGRWLGTTSNAEFTPTSVGVLPRPEEQMVQGFHEGSPLNRVNPQTLPAQVQLSADEISPLHTRYKINAPHEFSLSLFRYGFPGWRARVDGEVVETYLEPPAGFLVVPVPAGEHVVEVEFVDTPARRLAWALSAISLALMVAGSFWRERGAAPQAGAGEGSAAKGTRVLGVALAVTAMHLLLLQPAGWLHLHSQGREVIPATHDVYAAFGDEIALLGYDAPQKARPGEMVEVTLYWKAESAPQANYQVFVHLLHGDGSLLAQSDKLNPASFPARLWPLDRYVRDVHRLTVPAQTAPGRYAVTAGLWLQEEGRRLPVRDEVGQPLGDHFVIQYLHVER